MRDARAARVARAIAVGLGQLALGREVLPEVGHHEGAVGAREGGASARRIIGVAGDDLAPAAASA